MNPVYEAKYEKEPNRPVAVKVIDLSSKKVSESYKLKFFPREVRATLNLKHKYIVPILEVFKERDIRAFIFMDKAKYDLLHVIESDKKIAEDKARKWSYEITDGLLYLHNRGWAHRDLKVENILISFDDTALISDFGFVKQSSPKVLSNTHCGSIQYAAPEVLNTNEPYDPMVSDVWSLGVLFYAMVTGEMPFSSVKPDPLRQEQRKAPQKIEGKSFSAPLKSLLKQMMEYNSEKRIHLSAVKAHEWFKPVRESSKTSLSVKSSSSVHSRSVRSPPSANYSSSASSNPSNT